jgi:hypothetical protein
MTPEVVRKIRRTAKNCGAIRIRFHAEELNISDQEMEEILYFLGYERISSDWFYLPLESDKRKYSHQNAVFKSTLKILKCINEVSVAEIWEGVQQQASRLNFIIAEESIFTVVLQLYGFSIRDSLVNWPYENPSQLSKRDKLFINLIDGSGPIVTFQEVIHAFDRSGMSEASAIQLLQFSPLPKRMGFGLYKLRGTVSSPIDYQQALERKSRIDRDSEISYTMSGEIIWRINVGGMDIRGSISSYGLPELGGNWQSYADSKPMGDVKVNVDFIWNLKPTLNELGVSKGDRVEMKFNMWTKELFVKKIINGLHKTF